MSANFLTLFSVLLAIAAGTLQAALPPAAQAAFDRGITAARLPDYPLALRHFEEARRLAWDAPEIYFNLGLAESKIPGRELRAIAWFGAYLAGQPAAPNTTAVRSQIDALLIRHQSETTRLLRLAEDSAEKISGSDRARLLYDVANAWADSGDLTATLKTIGKIVPTANDQDHAVFLPGPGKPSPKEQMQQHVRFYRELALDSLSTAQARAGDFESAHRTAAQIPSDDQASLLGIIAMEEYSRGDIATARKTMATALKLAAKLPHKELISFTEPDRSQVLALLAPRQVRIGDLPGARQSIESIRRADTKCWTWLDIANVQFEAGDPAAALASLAEEKALEARVSLTASDLNSLGKFTGELRAKIAGPPPIKNGRRPADWLSRLDAEDDAQACALHTRYFLDLTEFLKLLPAGDGPRLATGVVNAASKHVEARITLVEMMKQLSTN